MQAEVRGPGESGLVLVALNRASPRVEFSFLSAAKAVSSFSPISTAPLNRLRKSAQIDIKSPETRH